MIALLLTAVTQPAPPAPVPFAEVVAAAHADAAALPAGLAPLTRYLSAAHLPRAERVELYAVVSYHANALSRESKRVPPRKVTDYLWAVRLDDYRWSAATWEELRRVNHYFAVKVQVPGKTVTKTRTVTKTDQYQRQYQTTEEYTEAGAAVIDFIPAPWLPAKETGELVTLTGSATPIVRADEWLFQTAAQADRKGHGYYDWLRLTKRADAEKLAALDRKTAEELYRELAAIVPVSGVGLNNRQVFRYGTLSGSWWETRDANNNVERRNAVANLLDDYQHDAEEIVATLPNGLPLYYLSNAKGDQIDSVPDTIAPDHRSTNNDRRIHVGYSCVACHTDGGLRPIRDYARKLYKAETGLSLATIAADPAKARRLESVYLGPLDRAYKRDAGDFADAIEDVSGLKPAELAKAFEKRWSAYADAPVTLDRAAAEAGVTPNQLRDALRRYARGKGVIDPVLAGYLLPDEDVLPVRREYAEERFPVLMLVLQGANP